MVGGTRLSGALLLVLLETPPGFLVNEFILRDEHIRQFGFAILTGDAIERVKQILGRDARILEVALEVATGLTSSEELVLTA